MKRPRPERIEVSMDELQTILERARSGLEAADYEKLKAAIETLAWLTGELEKKNVSLAQLRQFIFGAQKTEKTSKVLGPNPEEQSGGESSAPRSEPKAPAPAAKKRPGHGRNGADAYQGAERVKVPHESMTGGQRCPDCRKGKLYRVREPHLLVRITGQAPLAAKVYELDTLRCNLCGEVFTAKAPQGVGENKYDEQSASMIAQLKYGSGVPFYRLEGLQRNLGIPLPASTQWEIVEGAAAVVAPAYAEMIRQAAQGEVLHNDDTGMKVLSLARQGGQSRQPEGEDSGEPQELAKRTGVFTSGIVSVADGHEIALFFTGRRHAGENLREVLKQRAAELAAPIQMCDALERNLPKDFATVLANCLAHGRRKFVSLVGNFPAECRYLLEVLRDVYRYEAMAREQKLSPEERLRFHQTQSGPLMSKLERWLTAQIEEKKVEPNSSLGKAISYMRKRWERLTLFLRQPGAPLDNNVVERALKKAILHRKNALFYRTENGARVGDIFMTLIYTAELAKANSFHYLTELQKHAGEVGQQPARWMPWTYAATLGELGRGPPIS